MQEISCTVVDGKDERYQFTWPDKKKSIIQSNMPSTDTLRPVFSKSKNFFNTENLYIEGDNKEVLKLLQESYLGQVKFIYIDPPYNTGNNLIYKNDFAENEKLYLERSSQFDLAGNRLLLNTESNGRFHTDWLNIMYPTLRFAKNLLNNEGYIAIAIDDNELYNLKKIADEAFGEINFIGTIVTRCNPQGRGKNNLDPVHEYHLLYAKNIFNMPLLKIKKQNKEKQYGYLLRSGTNSRKFERPYRFYPILLKDNNLSMITKEEYSSIYSPKTGFNENFLIELGKKYTSLGYKMIFPIAKNGEEKVWQRTYDRVCEEISTYIFDNGQIKVPVDLDRTPISLWYEDIYSNVSNGTNKLKKLFGDGIIPFDFSKSIFTVKDLISLNTSDNDIVMDFFPGSATTAHATMLLNAEDRGHRRFIMIQLPEPIDSSTPVGKLGYTTIGDIGRKRIDLAGDEIINNYDSINLDIGYRTLQIDSSNMKDVYYNPQEYQASLFDELTDNIKEDRKPEDLLFQVMLDLGVLLSSKIEETTIAEKKVFNVADGFLIACFDDNVTEEVITEIAKKQPYYFVMRDSSMANDSVATNFEQLFETYSPETVRKVL